jgi:Domain of unknown function (DUF4124)
MQRYPFSIHWQYLALTIGIGLAAAPIDAETYKWKDADGKVHYSDEPPPANAKEETTVKSRKQAAPAAPTEKGAATAKPETYTEQEFEFKKRQVEKAEREAAEKKIAAEAAEKKQGCDRARAQLRTLQAGGRVTRTNTQGEREYLNDAQIGQEIDRAKKSADSWCK